MRCPAFSTCQLAPPEFPAASERDHLGLPEWLPDEIDDDRSRARIEIADRAIDRIGEGIVQRAARRRERHADRDVINVDLNALHEPEIDDIDAKLWIEHLFQRRHHQVFAGGTGSSSSTSLAISPALAVNAGGLGSTPSNEPARSFPRDFSRLVREKSRGVFALAQTVSGEEIGAGLKSPRSENEAGRGRLERR